MTDLIKITRVQPLQGHWLRLWFSDGAVKDVDLGSLLARGGVFAAIRDDRSAFEAVRVKPESQTIDWPGDVDRDPDVLYGSEEPASGAPLRRLTITEPAAA
jgi:hypothetical protein